MAARWNSNLAGRPLTLYRADGTEAPVALSDRDGFEAELRILRRLRQRGQEARTLARRKIPRWQCGWPERCWKSRSGNGGENRMQALKDLKSGVMFWGGGDPVDDTARSERTGRPLRPDRRPGRYGTWSESREAWKSALAAEQFHAGHGIRRV